MTMTVQTGRITELAFALAGLRHAYANLMAGAVKDQKSFADGLIAPQIRRIEKLINAETDTDGETEDQKDG